LSPNKGVIDEAIIMPMSTWKPKFSKQQLDEVRKLGGCWMVVRGDENLADQFPELLEEAIGEPVTYRGMLNSEMRWSNVRVMEVRLE